MGVAGAIAPAARGVVMPSGAYHPTGPLENGVLVNIEDVCRELSRNPLRHLSLGSKELFHSNFLAWLAETYPEHLAAAFEQLIGTGDPGTRPVVERENHHLDLVLRLPGCDQPSSKTECSLCRTTPSSCITPMACSRPSGTLLQAPSAIRPTGHLRLGAALREGCQAAVGIRPLA
jgi:hypothetical protein